MILILIDLKIHLNLLKTVIEYWLWMCMILNTVIEFWLWIMNVFMCMIDHVH